MAYPHQIKLTPLAAACALLLAAGGGVAQARGADTASANGEAAEATMAVIKVEGRREDGDVGFNAKRAGAATKTDTPLIETPQAISVVLREQFEAQGAQTLRQTVGYSAGMVSSYFDSRGDSISARGGSSTQMLNGLQTNFGFYNNARPDPFTLERVEVLRGPSSVLYGQGGIGGIVNMVSKTPQAQDRREVQVQIGSHNRKQISADVNQVLDQRGHWMARIVAVGRDSDTQVKHVADDRKVLAPSLTWAPDANTSLTLMGQYQKDESGSMIGFFPWQGTLQPSKYGQIPTDTFISEPGWDAYNTKQKMLAYMFSHKFNDSITLRQNLRRSESEVDYRSIYTSFAADKKTGRPARPVFNADQRTVNRDLVQQLNELDSTLIDTQLESHFKTGPVEHTLLVGFDVQRAETRQAAARVAAPAIDVYAPVYGNFTRPGPMLHQPTTNLHQKGLYVQDQMKIAQKWVAQLGWRHDSVQNDIEGRPAARTDDKANTRRAGLLYIADSGWSPYISYAESFQPLGGVDLNNKPFVPQRGKQWEAGLKWQPAGRNMTTTLAIYDLRDQNRKTTDPSNPTNSIQVGEVKVRGLELESTGAINHSWDWIASYAYTDATVSRSNGPDLGKRVSSTPKHSASAWLTHKFALAGRSGFSTGGGVRYVGKSWDGMDDIVTPSATLLDAMLSYESGPWRLALNVTNLTDKVQITTCLNRGDCFYGQRRTAALTARYTW
ncbi:TonB-dependent siderophore receptor [Massilia sp. MB5]|uniref:TonB-dependent siderophore receptor n=1 Tax=Massilia sp. MB5 TaxID=2919578 RepID=UPI001F0D3A9D|nr:TonB-dependent siderophore receptor [Massilia sp. MB5]UMR30911.1 TonB-dependent siderophore receptor [Massilia sp. MB5]